MEIGLGTNNTDILSNMGENGKPGASLRAFRDFCPNAQIFGADIDRRILFEEERIRTAWVDQLALDTLRQLPQQFGVQAFDLIIDDGLHNTEANLNTLLFGMEAIKVGGFLVIEDIQIGAMPVWQVVDRLIDKSCFDSFIFHDRLECFIYSLQRKK